MVASVTVITPEDISVFSFLVVNVIVFINSAKKILQENVVSTFRVLNVTDEIVRSRLQIDASYTVGTIFTIVTHEKKLWIFTTFSTHVAGIDCIFQYKVVE